MRPGRVELPSHDNPNHIVICSVGDQRGQELASHFSRRVPVTLRTLSEIDDLTMFGLSEDLPESWTTFESKRSRGGTGRSSAEPGPGTAGAGASAAPGSASSTPQGVRR